MAQQPTSNHGCTVRLPESLHEKVRAIGDQKSISMNQLVMLTVSGKITRLDV